MIVPGCKEPAYCQGGGICLSLSKRCISAPRCLLTLDFLEMQQLLPKRHCQRRPLLLILSILLLKHVKEDELCCARHSSNAGIQSLNQPLKKGSVYFMLNPTNCRGMQLRNSTVILPESLRSPQTYTCTVWPHW